MSAEEAKTNGGNNPWSWLGLLKWSLAYTDGTSESVPAAMSDEDKEFLEKVMKEGIIDENERMKHILRIVTKRLDNLHGGEEWSAETQDETVDLLQELRDIVEQIDYARAFAAMKGMSFLLGCVSQEVVPTDVRSMCLGILATMAQHNPPIQKQLLEMGALATLSDIYFLPVHDNNPLFRAKIIQALSATVRSHELAENVFCQVAQAPQIMEIGLRQANFSLQKRTLFFLMALVTSDASSRDRVERFEGSIAYVGVAMLNHSDADIREMAIQFLKQVLQQGHSVNAIMDQTERIVKLGQKRVVALSELKGEEREYAIVELEAWKSLLDELSKVNSPDPLKS